MNIVPYNNEVVINRLIGETLYRGFVAFDGKYVLEDDKGNVFRFFSKGDADRWLDVQADSVERLDDDFRPVAGQRPQQFAVSSS